MISTPNFVRVYSFFMFERKVFEYIRVYQSERNCDGLIGFDQTKFRLNHKFYSMWFSH